MADRTVLTNRDLLQYWKGKHARWPHLSLLARLYAGMDSTSCQAERNFAILNCTLDNLRTGLAVDKVEQLMLLRLNKQLIPEIASLRDAEGEIFSRTQSRKKAVTDRVHAREAATAAKPGGHHGLVVVLETLRHELIHRKVQDRLLS